MIVTPVRPVGHKWSNLSFTSTLYLAPVLDLLLNEVPSEWQAELRLGLQEALVNAAKHGNSLDPCKQITVKFSIISQIYCWVITDQGLEPQLFEVGQEDPTPCHDLECGRGFYILRKIFDHVQWDNDIHRLTLCKKIDRSSKPVIV
ncbi:MAG: ATP-binding protein [Pseudanabaena sp.]|nr:ATP-binding protein [Pseudanabaena sp. M109S1SP2A07QC]MCA6585350.1 ATP-binding protein [Pseudanabaena sp. M051S1SP1A06QC]MCA6597597.1 ATP-binding protein [Pseudanabaena sp. M046S1SP1A06QC]MCA6604297.1 ATP-binding protein [Pseudanabaena sp. M007S1SP1A06QC]MCA6612325.1 ATP-binding protein [Pseudanabaena sp. M158S2SP1A06QC]MCA6616238.1 ATP-binding protein [Pseudanabaena sp. M090S1SP1A06QC]MCA6624456.1 ATP-binding protein [Pseudanabaena sp. M165S2SP1A06QC]MCE2978106.1 ATP-binding protein [Pse